MKRSDIPIFILLALLTTTHTLKISSSKNIHLNALSSSDFLFIKLEQLDEFSKDKRVQFINKLIEKYPNDLLEFKKTEETGP
jgi:hypothetical protein